MAITNIYAINFSNERLRGCADRLVRTYNVLKDLNNRWNATTGTDDEKVVFLKDLLIRARRRTLRTYEFLRETIDIWNADQSNWNALIPNDVNELVYDNADRTGQDTTRPLIEGRALRRVVNRCEEFVSWLEHGTSDDPHFESSPTLTLTRSFLYQIHKSGESSFYVGETVDSKRLAVNRANDLITEYETTNAQKFNHILAVAVVNNSVDEV